MQQSNFLLASLCLLLTVSGLAMGQLPTDSNAFSTPYPETGAWYADDGSRTGFFIEIQNGLLAGSYFGFDANGENVWLLFNGELTPVCSNFGNLDCEIITGWRIETSLTKSRDGGCIINCTAGTTNINPQADPIAEMVMEFSGRNAATFSIDSQTPTAIQPLYFGSPAIPLPTAQPFTRLPELTGTWVFASTDLSAEVPVAGTGSDIMKIGAPSVFTINNITPITPMPMHIVNFPILSSGRNGPSLFPENSSIQCTFIHSDVDPEKTQPNCVIAFSQAGVNPFSINAGSISDTRFTIFENLDIFGNKVRYDFFRLIYD